MKRALNYEQVKKLLLDEIERCPPDSNFARWFRHGLRRALRCVEEAQAYDQVAWERDLAVQQLKDYGVGLGQRKNENLAKVTHCKDCKYGDYTKDYVWLPSSKVEELVLRDKFFQQLHDELSCKMDGTDLVEEIPDIDLEE